jgi:hypothetical protein
MNKTVPDTLEELLADYQAEIQRADKWKLMYQECRDGHDGTIEELRRANLRIKLLEKELEVERSQSA